MQQSLMQPCACAQAYDLRHYQIRTTYHNNRRVSALRPASSQLDRSSLRYRRGRPRLHWSASCLTEAYERLNHLASDAAPSHTDLSHSFSICLKEEKNDVFATPPQVWSAWTIPSSIGKSNSPLKIGIPDKNWCTNLPKENPSPTSRHVLSRFSEQVVETRGNVAKQGFSTDLDVSCHCLPPPDRSSCQTPSPLSLACSLCPMNMKRCALQVLKGRWGGGGRSGPKIVTAIMPGGGCARPARPHLATAWALVPGSRVLGFNVGPWV